MTNNTDMHEFARQFPPGTTVKYFPLVGLAHFERAEIASYPWQIGSGDVIVKLDGYVGGVSIDHIEKLDDA